MTMRSPQSWQVNLILITGVLSVSTTAIWIRLALDAAGQWGIEFSLFLAASRLIIASCFLLPAWRNFTQTKVSFRTYGYALGAGISLAFHFAFWITSLSFTSIAASTTLVTTNPVWVAILSWLWFKEKPTTLTSLGIIIALGGSILIALGNIDGSGVGNNPMLGNILALLGAWMVSLYLILGKEAQQQGLTVSNYIVIVYTTAALLLFPLPFILGSGYTQYPQPVYLYVLLMAIFSQLIGHTSINWSVRWISPTLVTLAILFEPIGSSFLGFLVFKEVPSLALISGAIILLLGVTLAIIGSQKRDKSA